MKRLITAITAVAAVLTISAQDLVPAFPGAEGHGRYAVDAGREGVVRHVTTLEDNGSTSLEGSLRWAVNGSTNKIVVFDVGGTIELKSELSIGANTYIAGQTAPSPGITIRYYTVRPKGNNICMRFIRVRRGQEVDINDGADAIWTRQYTGMIIDHCSFSWSIDEIASFYDNNNFTMQWCTLAEALANAGHGKGAHSYGGIWGGKLASFHHNFLAHMQNRVPRFNGARYMWAGYTNNKFYSTYNWENYVQAENVDFRNSVMYNWGTGGCYGGPGGGYINMVNNYYKAGPATKNKTRVTQITVGASGNSTKGDLVGMTSRYYINGNYVAAASNPENYDWSGVVYDGGTYTIDGERCSVDGNNFYGDTVPHYTNSAGTACVRIKLDSPAPAGDVTTHTAVNAYEKVLSYAGASLYRDAEDTRYMEETRNGTATYTGSVTKQAGIIDLVSDVGGYTPLESASRPDNWDTDQDGIPDDWETANGLDPNDASDGKAYTLDPKGWYTNVEVYVNSIVQDIMTNENQDAETTVDEYWPTVTAAGIRTISDNGGDVVKTACYSMSGMQVKEDDFSGVVIKKETLGNGKTRTRKIIK